MNFKFNNKKITGILAVVPDREIEFDDEIDNYNFKKSQSMKLKLIMGYKKRRIVHEGTSISDLIIHGMRYLFENGQLNKEDIDALLLVTQSPDHFMPATSYIIHGELGLKHDVICMDINQGCSGYAIGLHQAFMMLEQDSIKKVVLINADVLSKKVSKRDRNNNPQIGDGASITIVEKDQNAGAVYGAIKTDGSGADVLTIPAGGFKIPSNEQTGILKEDASGNFRALDHLVMKGDEVFNFVQREVPVMIEQLLAEANVEKENIDFYMFHQPNKFMLKKLADKMNVPYEKMPNNIVENFGNSSSVTIPTTITYNMGNQLLNDSFKMCLSGFGVGLSWSALVMDVGRLKFCELIEFKK